MTEISFNPRIFGGSGFGVELHWGSFCAIANGERGGAARINDPTRSEHSNIVALSVSEASG
jgi:hypothetical protein